MWGGGERKGVLKFSQQSVLKTTDYGYVSVLLGNYLPNYTVSYHKTSKGGKKTSLLKFF